jgi:hypothetical protein
MNTNSEYRVNFPAVKTMVTAMLFVVLVSFFENVTFAQSTFRRATSPQQPMWQIHIDVWNNADPQAIIDLVPDDIKPYVVMNVSMSINHNASTGQWLSSEYGYETSKSWVRTCAENRMWCMVQQSSGGLHHFPETDLSMYEEFYRDYPNFLGFNYAEQFWAFDAAGDIRSSKWVDRINLFAKLLELGNKYGGYLTVSWCGNQFDANINPLAMLKRNPAFEAACKKYPDNYIPCEKYTQGGYLQDMESLFLGVFFRGTAGTGASGMTRPAGPVRTEATGNS